MAAARVTQRLLASLTSLAIVAQFFLAGAGAFHATSFDPHRTLGWIVVVLGLAPPWRNEAPFDDRGQALIRTLRGIVTCRADHPDVTDAVARPALRRTE